MNILDSVFPDFGDNAGASTVHVSTEDMLAALDQFVACPVAQHAFDAYMSELDRCALEWAVDPETESPETGVDAPVPRPDVWRAFVRDTTRNFLVCGFSASARTAVSRGAIIARALHPKEVSARYTQACRLKIALSGAPIAKPSHIRVVVTEDAPCFATGVLQSCAHRAKASSVAYKAIVDNYMERDHRNTHPSIYTSVSKELVAGSDTSTWFSPRGASSFNDRDFNALLTARERAIDSLTSITTTRRQNETGSAEKEHVEHIVTDGQAFTEARQLQSQNEARNFKDQLMLQIYKFYRVPPQAVFGEQVNAERAGVGLGSSSAAMQAKCVQNWNATIEGFLRHVNDALRAASETPQGAYLVLERPIAADAVAKLAPMLTAKATVKHMARIYGIPESDFDVSRLEREATSEPDRKQKRSRIEREQAFATTPT